MAVGRPPTAKTETVDELMELQCLLERIRKALPSIEQAMALAMQKARKVTGLVEGARDE